jgi:hypothetical protein
MHGGNLPYSANNFSFLRCEQHHIKGESTLDSMLVVDTETATLAWLISALKQARTTQEQSKAIGYLEALANDVLCEMEMAARRSQ